MSGHDLVAAAIERALYRVQGYMLEHHDFLVSIMEYQTAANTPTEDEGEHCESCQPECGPAEFHDSEGVPLCAVCWEGLLADSAPSDEAQP